MSMESNDDLVDNLRGSLDRRNQLLDVIRKAYHRDVLVVKEYLKQHGLQESSFLDSLPSVDLRETFRLFAPEGCELQRELSYIGIQTVFKIDGGECSKSSIGVGGY